MELKIEVETTELLPAQNTTIWKYRQWFRDAVDFWHDWQKEAREDYEFVEGKQWSFADISNLKETGRVPLVINRIKPLINLLSGYQKLHRYDVNFLGRTPDDVELAEVRKEFTKYILDRCDYENEDSAAFIDMVIGGIGWEFVGYKIDEETGEGEAYVQRENPFSVYPDPEAHKADFSDRDLKAPQREINKRRLQQLHILNHSGNGGYFIEEDAMSEKQFADFQQKGSLPGYVQRVKPMSISQGKILERQVGQYPAGLAQAEIQATNDLTAISGLNEALMGVDVPSNASGRAIQLKQQQAVTHLANCFDAQRTAKKKMAYLLWGSKGRAGIIPQFYTAEKVFRVEGVNGQKFITINQQVIEQDPLAGNIVKTLNDLSVGDFDIVVSDIESSITNKQARAWLTLDALTQLQLPPDIAYDILIDNLDIPNKDELKQFTIISTSTTPTMKFCKAAKI